MRKILFAITAWFWLLVVVLCCSYVNATTLTGTLKLPSGTGATGQLIFSLAQQAALVSTGGCGGPAEIVPTAQVIVTVTAGALIGSPTIYGNDCMNPQGTYYNVKFQDANANVLFTDRWQISGASIDIGTIVSVTIQGTTQTLGSTGVVLFNPTGNQIINQPAGTVTQTNFMTVTGTLIFPSGASCNAGGCTGLDTGNVTLSTPQTISGQKTFSSSLLFSGTTDVGSTANPANTGWFQNTVVANIVRINLGSVGSPTDFYYWQMNGVHQIELFDSVGNPVLNISEAGTPSMEFFGILSSSNGYLNTPKTGDQNCSGFADGYTVLRRDVTPPQLQVCVGNTLYRFTSTL